MTEILDTNDQKTVWVYTDDTELIKKLCKRKTLIKLVPYRQAGRTVGFHIVFNIKDKQKLERIIRRG